VKRIRTSLVRRVVMWAAGVVLVVSVAGWLLSLACVGCESPFGEFWVTRGELALFGYRRQQWHFFSEGFAPPLFQWPRWRPGVNGAFWLLVIPLWMPASSAGIVLGLGWRRARSVQRRRVRTQLGLCPSCRYDLSGITGPCPECGNERERGG
jgi:hypothetical protein